MLWRMRTSRGRPKSVPAAFIHPCRPTPAKHPPQAPAGRMNSSTTATGCRSHVRDGRVGLYTMNGANWTDRYPRIIEEAARIKGAAILDAKVVCLDGQGVPQFDTLHSRTADQQAVACAFNLLMRDGDDLRRRPLLERTALGKLLIRSRMAAFSMWNTPRATATRCLRPSAIWGLRALFQRNSTHPIDQDHRKAGSSSRTQKRQRR